VTDPHAPRRRYKISNLHSAGPDNRSYIAPDLPQALDFLHTDLESADTGTVLCIAVMWITDSEFDALPEWKGW